MIRKVEKFEKRVCFNFNCVEWERKFPMLTVLLWCKMILTLKNYKI